MAAQKSYFLSRRQFAFRTIASSLIFSFLPVHDVFSSSITEWYYKIIGRMMPNPKSPPESERKFVGLPMDGFTTSLEAALNSRCTSDNDGNSNVFHWGMFDLSNKLTPEDIQKIVEAARIPKITGAVAEVLVSGNELLFRIEKASIPIQKDWRMVESGMQQQAVCLVCAALGAGMVFRNMGRDGSESPDGQILTVKMNVGAMSPSYGGSFWTNDAPGAPWQKGNLPEPDRKGSHPLLQALAGLKLNHAGNATVTEGSLGQVLWAARGRTPHRYKSRHCGITVPTWAGDQNISGIYLLREDGLLKYINEIKGTPTHGLETFQEITPYRIREILKEFKTGTALLVFARNEDWARAFWEVGYQFLNAILQAAALDLSYQAVLLNESEKALIQSIGNLVPVAALALG